MKKIVITGVAGFIGFHLCQALLALGHRVYGLDRLNAYYDPALKRARLEILSQNKNFVFHQVNLKDFSQARDIIVASEAEIFYHLAAQAGVRYSLEDPQTYMQSNLAAFLNVLEICRHHPPQHFIYASSSSVYGLNDRLPFKETDMADRPASLYAATKKSNELMAYAYAHLYGLATTGLRFFTVYGPWGRPDMAYYRFARLLIDGKPLPLYNQGQMERDFTYIGDAVTAMVGLMDKPSTASPSAQIFNLGNGRPTSLRSFVETLAELMGRPIIEQPLPMQPGDVHRTYADTTALRAVIDWQPRTSLREGLAEFVDWFETEGQKYRLSPPRHRVALN